MSSFSHSSNVMAEKRILILLSSLSCNRQIANRQDRALQLLQARNIPYDVLDGALAENKEIRNQLFELSGMRAVYPQFFLLVALTKTATAPTPTTTNGMTTTSTICNDPFPPEDDEEDHTTIDVQVLGDWEAVEAMNDASDLPDDVLSQHPSIMTWEKLFAENTGTTTGALAPAM